MRVVARHGTGARNSDYPIDNKKAVRSTATGNHFMRIAEVAPLAESVPPKLFGGTERVVSWLTDALLDLNCSVTLFASGDSKTRARLVAVCPQALRLSKPVIDRAVATSALIDAVATWPTSLTLFTGTPTGCICRLRATSKHPPSRPCTAV